jgi:ferredoxin-type protein NapH
MKKTKLPLILIVIYTIIGLVVAFIRKDIKYVALFEAIGLFSAAIEYIVSKKPELRQLLRITLMCIVGGGLFGFLSLYRGVNFQFPQIFFDASAGVITGALIQLIIARLVLPFFFGNAFCSRACWNGIVFEMTNSKTPIPHRGKKRSEIVAWAYLLCLVVTALTVSTFSNPAEDEAIRKLWIIGENIWIVLIGIFLTTVWGSRAYCRMLCPFLTVSGLFSRYSIFKITPVKKEECYMCGICNKTCPMHVDIMNSVRNGVRINQRTCILCERCVDACPVDCLKMAPGIPWA